MLKINQRKEREFEVLELDQIYDILKTDFANRKLYIRYSMEKTEIVLDRFNDDDKSLMVIVDPTYEPVDNMSIYGLAGKYLEIDLGIVEEKGPGYYKCSILNARRAIQGRKYLRFKLPPDDAFATNFRISKHTIDITGFHMPTSIKVILDQFQTTNSGMSDIIKVDVFKSSVKDIIMNSIKKSGKAIFIPDASVQESYRAVTEDFIDLAVLLGDDLNTYINKNIEKGYKSIILVPIVYISESEDSIPFAYIQLVSKSENFDIEKVLELKELSFKLVDRIRDANTQLFTVHQQVVDISRGGARLRISDNDLKKYMSKSKGLIFDIVFKLQAPITMYGEIRMTSTSDDDDDLYVGIDFAGNSSRKDEMKRFGAVLKPMEAEYKARLMKSLNIKK